MRAFLFSFACGLLIAGLAFAAPAPAPLQVREATTCPAQANPAHDGAHDFDWEHGEWRTQLPRLQEPLSGATRWVEYEGSSNVRPALDGRANLVELSVAGPSGRIEGLSLRLYNPQSRQWRLHFANIRFGELTPPTIGAFNNGCGEFYAQDALNGRAILVRFVIQQTSANSARFEQSFSADGGRTWELNWIAVDTRIR